MDTLLVCSFFQLCLAPYILIFPHNHHGWKVFCSATSNSTRIGYFHWALESFFTRNRFIKRTARYQKINHDSTLLFLVMISQYGCFVTWQSLITKLHLLSPFHTSFSWCYFYCVIWISYRVSGKPTCRRQNWLFSVLVNLSENIKKVQDLINDNTLNMHLICTSYLFYRL